MPKGFLNMKILENVNRNWEEKTAAEHEVTPLYHLANESKNGILDSKNFGVSSRMMSIRSAAIRESLNPYLGRPHRMEEVASVGGVKYINYSRAANVNAVWFALESIESPVILILGGLNKSNDYNVIKNLVREKVKAIICLGVNNEEIHKSLEEESSFIEDTTSMKEAVELAHSYAQKGDVVLLSPACASFDLFQNYEDRGEQFARAVRSL